MPSQPASIPSVRLRAVNAQKANDSGRYVVYWVTTARRAQWNFALDRSIQLARTAKVPLIVLEPLRLDYRWASARLHHFIIDGMRDNARAFADSPIAYYPYVERHAGAGKGLLATLAQDATAVVTDDFPCFFVPRMVAAAGRQLTVRLEAVDSNGLYPLRATDRIFTTAASFRRHLQKQLPALLGDTPEPVPLHRLQLPAAKLPDTVTKRWNPELPSDEDIARLDIDHNVERAPLRGGTVAAKDLLTSFLRERLPNYADDRNQPTVEAQSYLSPYLHFGHISAHHIFHDVMTADDWSPDRIADKANGSRSGFWGASRNVEAFLDEIITWRELGYNKCTHDPNYASLSSLPDWATTTLENHANDPRAYTYSLKQFEAAATHDDIWNAAQRQLVRDGTIHNYLRMLWGKKILEWTRSPDQALEIMLELNNKYALDGRNPNSYSGIFWVLGRYDRAWGPERAIFGKVRYMSSASTARKLRLKPYLERYAA